MSKRSAVDTIKGYFYQFDYSIKKILDLHNHTDEITVEGIEDIDVETSTEITAVQCKYYSKTEYNHSVISKPIRLMLTHFKEVKLNGTGYVRYHLYGYFKSGQDKLDLPIDVNFLKDRFLSYKEIGVQKKHYDELDLDDRDLQIFLDLLSIDINAKEYTEQYNDIIALLKNEFSSDGFDAEYYYYNCALNEIRKISIENNISDRKITKGDFIRRIDRKYVLFNKWFMAYKGKQQYFKELKNKYFRKFNQSPFERFFIIELPENYNIGDLKELVLLISKRYSNLKKREPKTYCPYICFNKISTTDLLKLKQQLYVEQFNFIDGFPFLNSGFSTIAITTKADSHNKIKAKLIGDVNNIGDTLSYINKTKEIYQFYFDKPIFSTTDEFIKNIEIQISELDNIKEII